jgi:hypothetical protein
VSRNRFRVIIYGYSALLVLGFIALSKESSAVATVWLVVGFGLMAGYVVVRGRRARHRAAVTPPAGHSNEELLRRMAPALILGGASFLLLGLTVMTLAKGGPTTPHLVWGLLLLSVGAAMLIWAALLRFRRPTDDS